MLKDSNLIYLVLVTLPALLYSTLLCLILPKNVNINIRTCCRYIFNGILSTIVITVLHYCFPYWCSYLFKKSLGLSILSLAFIQVALTEEVLKLIMAKISESQVREELNFRQIFFYTSLSSIGFAIAENFSYLAQSGPDVIIIRATSATIIHFILGIIMGYYVAMQKKTGNWLYLLGALYIPMAIHGLYDANFMFVEAAPNIFGIKEAIITMIDIFSFTSILCLMMIKEIYTDHSN